MQRGLSRGEGGRGKKGGGLCVRRSGMKRRSRGRSRKGVKRESDDRGKDKGDLSKQNGKEKIRYMGRWKRFGENGHEQRDLKPLVKNVMEDMITICNLLYLSAYLPISLPICLFIYQPI